MKPLVCSTLRYKNTCEDVDMQKKQVLVYKYEKIRWQFNIAPQ